MTGINHPFTGSPFDHDQGSYEQWVDRQANLRAAKEASAERRALARVGRQQRRTRRTPHRSAALDLRG